MTNIQFVGKENIQIPDGYYNIKNNSIVNEGDMVCMVSLKKAQSKKDFLVTWLKVDLNEVGKEKKFAGEIVIRRYDGYISLLNSK